MTVKQSPGVIARANTYPKAWLDEIERKILNAEAPADFVPEIATEWKRTRRQVWRYVAKVRARLVERAKAQDPDADREQIRAMLCKAFRTADTDRDAKGMVAAAKALADVTGITATKKLDVTSNGETITVLPGDPRWADLQREHLGAARQGVSNEARPDGDADPLAEK